MKTNYSFNPKVWLRFGLITTIAISLTLTLKAQNYQGKQWDRSFGGTGTDVLRSLKQTSDGGYITGGGSNSNISGDKSESTRGGFDYWIVKTNSAGNKIWDKTFGGNNTDNLLEVQQTPDGGYILGGTSLSGISGNKTDISIGMGDYWVIKLDGAGNKLWDKTFGGSEEDFLYSMQQTSDGGYILGGTSKSGISGNKTSVNKGLQDYWVVKLDAAGNKQWDKTYGGSNIDDLRSLKLTTDGGFILGGSSYSGISGDKTEVNQTATDYWIVKLDAAGNKQWDRTFGGDSGDEFQALQLTSDGGYILGGVSSSQISGAKSEQNKGGSDYWVVKIDSVGNKQWDKTYGGGDNDYLTTIQQTSNGGYLIGGYSRSDISWDKSENKKGLLGVADIWILKLNNNGNKAWDKTIGGTEEDRLYSLIKTLDGGFMLGGQSASGISADKSQASRGFDDFWLIKLGPEILGTSKTQPTFSLSISPNPNQGKSKLHLTDLKNSTAEITVTDLLGRVILQKQLPVTDNQLSEELEIKAAKGMFLLQVKAGNQTIARKIVIE